MQRFLIFLAVIFEVSRFLLTNLLHLGSIIELISLFFNTDLFVLSVTPWTRL